MKTNGYFTGVGPAGTVSLWTRGLTETHREEVRSAGNGRLDLPAMPVGARVLFLASDWVGDGREWHDALRVDDTGEWTRMALSRDEAKAWIREVPRDY